MEVNFTATTTEAGERETAPRPGAQQNKPFLVQNLPERSLAPGDLVNGSAQKSSLMEDWLG